MTEIAVVMGSKSDWPTVRETCLILDQFGVDYEKHVISAHRMPDEMFAFAKGAVADGLKVVIACAGGAAHLPGMLAANTPLPVIGIPAQTRALGGMDSLLSIVQMPAGVPVATTAIGVAGAKNAALLALEILGITNREIQEQILDFRQQMHDAAQESEASLD